MNTLALIVGWMVIVGFTGFVVICGLPLADGESAKGVTRFTYYGIGLVLFRVDKNPALFKRLCERGYRFIGWRNWQIGLSLPGWLATRLHG